MINSTLHIIYYRYLVISLTNILSSNFGSKTPPQYQIRFNLTLVIY
jgi:hypothetical protein